MREPNMEPIPLEIDITEAIPLPDQNEAIELAKKEIREIIDSLMPLIESLENTRDDYEFGSNLKKLSLRGFTISQPEEGFGEAQKIRVQIDYLVNKIRAIAENVQFSPNGRLQHLDSIDIYQEILPELNQAIGDFDLVKTPELIRQELQLIGMIRDAFGGLLAHFRNQEMKDIGISNSAGSKDEILLSTRKTVSELVSAIEKEEFNPYLLEQFKLKIMELQQNLSGKEFPKIG